jgi:hypothetical protein
MCSLAGDYVENGSMEVNINGNSIDIIIRGDYFLPQQIYECSQSCNNEKPVSCADDDNHQYDCTCQKVCCLSCGSTCNLTSCRSPGDTSLDNAISNISNNSQESHK